MTKKTARASITFCYACGYCLDLMLRVKIDFNFEKTSEREQMLTITLCNLHIYIDADYKKDIFSCLRIYCTTAGTHLLCQQMFATYYQEILFKSSGSSVVSDPRNVLRDERGRPTKSKLEFLNRPLYSDGVLWIMLCFVTLYDKLKSHFLNYKKTMFTVATLVLMFIIINPGPYHCSKQSKTFNAKCNVKVNCEKNCFLLTKNNCLNVRDLNAVRHTCRALYVFF